MKFHILILVTTIMFGCLKAQPNNVLQINSKTTNTNLEGYIFTATNLDFKNPKELISQKSKFKKLEQSVANFGLNNDENWIYFEVENQTNSSLKLVLFLDQTFLDHADFYQFQGDSLVSKYSLNYKISIENRPAGYPNFEFPFTINPKRENCIFLRIKPSPIKGVSRGLLYLYDEKSFHKSFRRNFFGFGILTGFLTFSFVLGVILFYFSRKRIYWIYGLYILVVLSYYLANNGFLNAISSDGFLGSPRFEYVSSWIAGSLHFWFIKKFLELKIQLPKSLNYILKVLIVFPSILVFIYLFLPIPAQLSVISRIFTFIYSFTIIILGIWAILKRHNHTLLYSFATFPSILLIIYFLFTALKILPLYSFVFNLPFPFTVFEVIVFGAGLVYQFNEERQTIERKLNEERAAVANKVIIAQEHERQRIAQDLHDDLGSTLSILKFRLEELNKSLDNQLINEVQTANKAVEDLRLISYNLMPTMFLQRGLVIALQEFININKIGSLVSFLHSGKEKKLDWEYELSIFRIVKELLNNAIKHAKASKIELQLIYFDDFIYLSVEDNGAGMKENQGLMRGNGLKNINLRVNHLNGKINLESSANGTMITIEIPYEPNQKDKINAD